MPKKKGDMDIAKILEELSHREPIFHRPEFGTTPADFERMTVEDYWEVGASGRTYDRTFVLQELQRRFARAHTDIWETSDFRCRRLAPDVYLAKPDAPEPAVHHLAAYVRGLENRLPPGHFGPESLSRRDY